MRVTRGACIKPGCLARPLLFHKVNLPRCEALRRLFISGLNSMIYIIYILLPCLCIRVPRLWSMFKVAEHSFGSL